MKKEIKSKCIVVIIVILILGVLSFTISRYITKIDGMSESSIAKFNFIVNGKSFTETGDVDFSVTRTDDNLHVNSQTIAPGTYGVIPISVEASGSETYLEYMIKVSLSDKPENLRLYYDEKMTTEIIGNDNIYIRKGFFSFDDNILTKNENIYWNWKLETGETEEEILKNDKLDNKWINNSKLMMNISVTRHTGKRTTKVLCG